MDLSITRETAALQGMTSLQLRIRYRELYGQEAPSGHRDYLWKRIIWQMQALAQGGLSDRARRRAGELAREADLRVRRPSSRLPLAVPLAAEPRTSEISFHRGPDALRPGMQLVRPYKGRRIDVTVRGNGFEYEGKVYRSLTAVAEAVTGSHWNGYDFFGLKGDP